VTKLAQEKPSFMLPAGTYTQTRSPRKDETQTTELFKPGKDIVDAYLNFDREDSSLWVIWNTLELSPTERELLSHCLAYCRYLGRREADAVWTVSTTDKVPNAYPDPSGRTQVACSDGKIESLLLSSYETLAKDLRSTIPGLIWEPYHIETQTKATPETIPVYQRADLAIRAKGKLKAESFLVWANRLHQSLIAKLEQPTPNFSGRDEQGNPLTSHEHVFIQPILADNELIGFTLHSYQGFSDPEIKALYSLERLRINQSNSIEIRVADFSLNYGTAGNVWESSTPFFLTRYPLLRNGHPRWIAGTHYQKDGAEHQALKALCYLPHFKLDPKTCQFEEDSQGLRMLHKDQTIAIGRAELWPNSHLWKTDRPHGQKTLEYGFKIYLTFPEPVEGVIGIGYNSHFGLGCLQPQRS
jgi:CRISPR-associated protein Csb2